MNEMPKITEAEYEIMKLIWKEEPISTNEVVKRFESISDWSPTKRSTLIRKAAHFSKNFMTGP